MSYADKVYRDLIYQIKDFGCWDYVEDVRTQYSDGKVANAKSIFGHQVKFPKGVVPLITTKKMYTKTAIKEMLLFWVHQTVNIQTFKEWGVNIWNEWELEDGTLGLSYAAQFQKGERNQVVELLEGIKNTPKSRRLMTSFWDFENVQKKALQECAWATQWDVRNGALNLLLIQRSVDTACGLPFNWWQYYVLQCLVAHCSGLDVGTFTHQMGNVHYYCRHEELLLKQVQEPVYETDVKVLINEALDDFFKTELSDIVIENFKCSNKKFEYEIAI